MGRLDQLATGTQIRLRARHLVGRSGACDLRLDLATVSGEHATVYWAGGSWRVRDLGSRNGTWVGGHRLQPGMAVHLAVDASVAFGAEGDRWRLVDAAPPTASALPDDEHAEAVYGTADLLALPDSHDPQLTLHRDGLGVWWLERGESVTQVSSGDGVSVRQTQWTLELPERLDGTVVPSEPALGLDELELEFKVSPDEEYVELALLSGAEHIPLRARAHNEVLLVLARARLGDVEAGVAASEEGWVYLDDLRSALRSQAGKLRVAFFRARKQLADAGIADAAGIIERRETTKQIRIGVRRLRIGPL